MAPTERGSHRGKGGRGQLAHKRCHNTGDGSHCKRYQSSTSSYLFGHTNIMISLLQLTEDTVRYRISHGGSVSNLLPVANYINLLRLFPEWFIALIGRFFVQSTPEQRNTIFRIGINDSTITSLLLQRPDVRELPTIGWRFLGQLIANNDYLKCLRLSPFIINFTDAKMVSLFEGLVASSSLEILLFEYMIHLEHPFGLDGIKRMVKFLRKAPELKRLGIGNAPNFGPSCFEAVMSAIHPTLVELSFGHSNITNLPPLHTNTNISNLQKLSLYGNDIGAAGFITIADMLLAEGLNLAELNLNDTGLGDEGTEVIANSLRYNTKLTILKLRRNNITEEGYKAIIKVLIDVSSIGNTYNSNHTLTVLETDLQLQIYPYYIIIQSALKINREKQSAHQAGRHKVIHSYLNSQTRGEISSLAGIAYSRGTVLAETDYHLLPFVLRLISECGLPELYTALEPRWVAPDPLLHVDTNAMRRAILIKEADDLLDFILYLFLAVFLAVQVFLPLTLLLLKGVMDLLSRFYS